MNDEIELSLPTLDIMIGEDEIDVFKKMGLKAEMTPLALLTGGKRVYLGNAQELDKINDGWYLALAKRNGGVGNSILEIGDRHNREVALPRCRTNAIRPVIYAPLLIEILSLKAIINDYGIEEVEFGEYPQEIASEKMQKELSKAQLNNKLLLTGNTYTFDSTNINYLNQKFQPVTYDEYEYLGKKYINLQINHCETSGYLFLRNKVYMNGAYVWMEVRPVTWFIGTHLKAESARNEKVLVSKKSLLAGIRVNDKYSVSDLFKYTEMQWYLNNYMKHDLFQNVDKNKLFDVEPEAALEMAKIKMKRILKG